MDMDLMASNSYRSACRRPWQKSMDSQEFGFASNLKNSMEVAPADELFFKGQLLPLQLDPRLHLVQALSCEEASSRGTPSRSSYASQDEEVSEYKSVAMSSLASDISTADHCPLVEHAPASSEQGLQRELSMLSWCEGKELLSCRVEGDMGLDNMASIKDHDNPPLDRAPPCDRADPPRAATPQSEPRLSLCCIDEEAKGPWLSYWSRDEEITFNSCRIEGDMGVTFMGNSMMDLRSSSFRSQNSGFWDSGADKDTGDSSSSSRDSNGSSQDSYLPNSTTLEAPSCPAPAHGPHAKASFHILWKSLLKKASIKAATSSPSPSSPLTISRMGYSEDLSKYKDGSAQSSEEVLKEVITLLPWKLDSVAYAEKSRNNQDKKGKSKGILSSGFKSKSALCNAAEEDVIVHMSTVASKGLILSKGKGGRDDHEKEEMKRKEQRSAAIKGRWQGYARRLRPLYEMRRGLMGQFGIDECGRRACEAVESGNIYAATSSTPVQRRLSHQISLFEKQKLKIQEQNHVCVHTVHMQKGSNMLAMSSCPPSTRSSPKHSGVLNVAIDKAPKHKSTTKTNISKDAASTNKFGISATHANKNAKATSHTLPSSDYSSMSTMHELHSALQSAIAHCKESIKEA